MSRFSGKQKAGTSVAFRLTTGCGPITASARDVHEFGSRGLIRRRDGSSDILVDASGEERPTTMSLPYLEWDDEAGWAAVGCAMPTDADLEGLSLDERELREGVAACGRRHTPESPCLANGDGVLFWVSLVDDPLGHVLVPDKGAFRSKTLAGLGAEAPTPYKASIDATRRKVVAAIAVSDVVLIDKPTFRALHTRTPTSSAFI